MIDYNMAGGSYRKLAKIAPRDDVPDAADAPEVPGSRLAAALASAGVGVFEHAKDGVSISWNDVMFEIFGQSKERFYPTQESWRALIHPEDLPRVRRLADEAASTRAPLTVRYRIVRPDGGIRHVESVDSSVDAAGAPRSRRIGVLLDLTDKVEAGRRERALEARLQESARRACNAGTANDVLRTVECALGDLGAAAATMRRHLASLRPERMAQMAGLLRDHRADIAAFLAEDVRGKYLPDLLLSIAGQQRANSQSLETEVAALDEVVRRMRDVISAHQALLPVSGRVEPTDLRDLVEAALLVQPPEFARIEVVREYDDLPLILTDRQKLFQIIVCFVSSAREALLAGGGPMPRVVMRIRREDDDAVFSIQDGGPGPDWEGSRLVWEQGRSVRREGEGFARLASAAAAREIGATLTVHSAAVGQGSCCSVRLPLGGRPQWRSEE